ncbi:MAG: heavy metal translocating P-type ATPase [Pseudomonadota bacterium]
MPFEAATTPDDARTGTGKGAGAAASIGAGCCAAGAAAALAADRAERAGLASAGALARFVRPAGEGKAQIDLLVPTIHCPACIATLERGLGALPGIERARVNLTAKRLSAVFDPQAMPPAAILAKIEALGHEARPYDHEAMIALERDAPGRALLARIGVAGFAMMNVMLLSVAVWSGAEGATRDLLHWVSALIALPAIAFAGRPFYAGAARAISSGRLNMDVPISVAIWLAAGVSLHETLIGGEHAYFDAGVGLVFFLLVGRYLDHRTRASARSAAAELATLSARSATRLGPDGTREAVVIEAVRPGDRLAVAPGERVPADGTVAAGRSDIDRSLVTGESVPEPAGPGDTVHAGMLNLTGALEIEVTATGDATVLAGIARLVEAAEAGRSRIDAWADVAARHYAWSVHVMATAAFAGWLWWTDGDVYRAVTIAAAVLIITCPCALGLAVPAVHAVTSGRLFRAGIFLKDGAALEGLAGADTAVFDKTGTLTLGQPSLAAAGTAGAPADEGAWALAAALARASGHPLARALAAAAAARGVTPATLGEIRELPGLGIEGELGDGVVRLGRAGWVSQEGPGTADEAETRSAVWLAAPGRAPVPFRFEDRLREDAAETVSALRARGLRVLLLSGDAPGPVAAAARDAGIEDFRAGLTPGDKLAILSGLADEGAHVLMVGDGLNDAPALAAAHVSISPASGADVSRAAAGLVFTGERLGAVVTALDAGRAAQRRARENVWMAGVYNVVAVPLAIVGMVTPLIAALAMSGSSLAVTLNALRREGSR